MEVEENSNIWTAASDGDLEVVRRYLEEECYAVDAADENGYTALLAAVSYCHLNLVEYLIREKQANPLVTDSNNNTLLHYCEDAEFLSGLLADGLISEEVMRQLSLVRSEDDQLLPIEYHLEEGNMEMFELLKEYTAEEVLNSSDFKEMVDRVTMEQQLSNDILQTVLSRVRAQAGGNHGLEDDPALR